MSFDVVNPATGETVRSYPELSSAQIDACVAGADAAQRTWRRESMDTRSGLLRNTASVLRNRAEELAHLMALEMGKPIAQGRAEVEKCASVCEFYAERGAELLAPRAVPTEAGRTLVTFQPLGLILAIMPWNFPLWQAFRFLAPALTAGNGALLKHAPNVPGCALVIEEILRAAGFPENLFRTLLMRRQGVPTLLDDPRVRAATLTGSTAAGRAVASQAGERIKKTVLELGGSDAYVVLEDADLERAADACATSRLINSGQSCIAAKRFVVVEAVRGELETLLADRLTAATVGDPFAEATEVGPMARIDLRDALHDQVRRSIDAGARCLLGGTVPDGPGAFYPPTLLTDVGPGMPAYHEELFGPVASILPVADEREAIRVANDSPYGLGAAVFTRDLARGERIATEELEAGCCCVNDFVRSDPRLPFGGVKDSGYGRELGELGILEFVNVKTVSVS